MFFSSDPDKWSWQWLTFSLTIVVLGGIQYSGSLDLPLHEDDLDYLEQAEAITHSPGALLATEYQSSGRPALVVLITLAWLLWGPTALPYQLITLLSHLIATIALARTLQATGYGCSVSCVAGFLFLVAITPYEVPIWLSCIAYSGCLVFGCLSIIQAKTYVASGKIRHLIYATVHILIASGFHPAALAIGPISGFFVSSFASNQIRPWKCAALLSGVGFLAASVTAFAYPEHLQTEALVRASEPTHLVTRSLAIVGHGFASPHWITPTYVHGWGPTDSVLGGVVVTIALLFWRRGSRVPRDAMLWSLLFAVMFSGSGADEYRARYQYLVAPGPALLYGWLLVEANERLRPRQMARYALIVSLFVLIVISSRHNTSRTIAMQSAGIGRSMLSEKDVGDGLKRLESALALHPGDIASDYYVRYATHAATFGVDSREILKDGMSAFPSDPQLPAQLVVAELARNWERPSDTWLSDLRTNTNLARTTAASLNNAGLYHLKTGQHALASKLLSTALLLVPKYTTAMAHLGTALAHLGQTDRAVKLYAVVLEGGRPQDLRTVQTGLDIILRLSPGHQLGTTLQEETNATLSALDQ